MVRALLVLVFATVRIPGGGKSGLRTGQGDRLD